MDNLCRPARQQLGFQLLCYCEVEKLWLYTTIYDLVRQHTQSFQSILRAKEKTADVVWLSLAQIHRINSPHQSPRAVSEILKYMAFRRIDISMPRMLSVPNHAAVSQVLTHALNLFPYDAHTTFGLDTNSSDNERVWEYICNRVYNITAKHSVSLIIWQTLTPVK